MNQRLYRSREDRIIAGVAGGLAAMLNVDPSIVRIVWVILVPLTGGFIILLYFVMAVVVPEMPIGDDRWAAWDRPWSDPWTQSSDMALDPGAGTGQPAMPLADAGMSMGDPSTAAGSGPADAGSPGDEATRLYPPAVAPGSSASTAGMPSADRPSAIGGAPDATGAARPGGPPAGAWGPLVGERRSGWQTPDAGRHDRGVPLIFGLILVLIGAFLLARAYVPGIDWEASWPFLLVGIGVVLLLGSLRRTSNPS